MNRKTTISISAFLGFLVLLALIRQCNSTPRIRARVSPLQTTTQRSVVFKDSTKGARQWKWDFGDGTKSNFSSGSVQFKKPGIYLIRLTVNEQYQQTFTIQVAGLVAGNLRDSVVRIIAPKIGYQHEKLVFMTSGARPARYSWRFGETGEINSREQTAIYSYAQPGRYEVVLHTDITRYAVKHRVQILAGFRKFEPPVDSAAIIGNDIRRRLQIIANGQAFNANYYYLLRRYLCRNHYAVVRVNNEKVNDFYSYCMGLQFDKGTQIDEVGIVQDTTSQCILKLQVTQHNSR